LGPPGGRDELRLPIVFDGGDAFDTVGEVPVGAGGHVRGGDFFVQTLVVPQQLPRRP
jgi:hypothetical protein